MRRLRLFVAAITFACGACFQPAFPACGLRCTATTMAPCPAGYDCRGGFCQRPGESCPEEQGQPATTQSRWCLRGVCPDRMPQIENNLVFWLDPSTLPRVGTPADTWLDKSRNGYAAAAYNLAAPPQVVEDGMLGGPAVAITQKAHVLWVPKNMSADFGQKEFLVAVVARVDSVLEESGATLFKKAGAEREPSRDGVQMLVTSGTPAETRLRMLLTIESRSARLDSMSSGIVDGRPHLFVMRRQEGGTQIRIDGRLEASARLDPATNIANPGPVFLAAVGADDALMRGALGAVIVLAGKIAEDDVIALETFLVRAFAVRVPP